MENKSPVPENRDLRSKGFLKADDNSHQKSIISKAKHKNPATHHRFFYKPLHRMEAGQERLEIFFKKHQVITVK
jgi:hypothetical protein